MKENMKRPDPESIHFKVVYLGIVMNVFVPALLVILGIFLQSRGIVTKPIKSLDLFLIILLIVSATEVFFVFFFRKKFFPGRNHLKEKASVKTGTEDDFIRYTLIIFSMCLSPTIYGLVYYLLGGTLEWFVIFACITLICFRFFKPGLEQVKRYIRYEDQNAE
jgi:hypothetical protein